MAKLFNVEQVKDRTPRQVVAIDKLEQNNWIGTITAYTGFGKTRGLALRAIDRYKPTSLIVAVPFIILKEDWELLLKDYTFNYQVIVVNTLIKKKYACDMLIVDEVHKFGAETFINTFKVVKYNKLLCLTASLERNDKRHELIIQKAPVIDNITLQEGLDNGWVQPFNIHKIPVELTKKEKKQYDIISDKYNSLVELFPGSNPLKEAETYLPYMNRKNWVIGPSGQVYFVKSIEKKLLALYMQKFKGVKMPEEYFNIPNVKQYDDVAPYINRMDYNEAMDVVLNGIKNTYKEPAKDHRYSILAKAAVDFYRVVKQRKSLLYNAHNKKVKTLELVEKHNGEYKFILAQEIAFLEELYEMLPKETTQIYHSKLTTKQRKLNYEQFIDKSTPVNTLLSAKALLTGIDIAELSVLIITSYSSSYIDSIQTIGRALRYHPGKSTNVYYLYVPDSQEVNWLKQIT